MKWRFNFNNKDRQCLSHSGKYTLNTPEVSQEYPYSSSNQTKSHNVIYLLKQIWQNRKLRLYLILSFVTLKIMLTLLFVFVVPFNSDFIDNLSQKGLNGIFELAGNILSVIRNSI